MSITRREEQFFASMLRIILLPNPGRSAGRELRALSCIRTTTSAKYPDEPWVHHPREMDAQIIIPRAGKLPFTFNVELNRKNDYNQLKLISMRDARLIQKCDNRWGIGNYLNVMIAAGQWSSESQRYRALQEHSSPNNNYRLFVIPTSHIDSSSADLAGHVMRRHVRRAMGLE